MDVFIQLKERDRKHIVTGAVTLPFLYFFHLFATLQVSDEAELEALCAEISSQHHSGESPDSPSQPCCTFTYVTMTGEEVELCQGGCSLTVR